MQRRGPVAGNYGVAKELFGILIEQASAEGWVNGSHRVKARASAGQVVPALQPLLTRTTPGANFPGRQLHSLGGPPRRCVLPPGRRVSSCKVAHLMRRSVSRPGQGDLQSQKISPSKDKLSALSKIRFADYAMDSLYLVHDLTDLEVCRRREIGVGNVALHADP